MSMPCNKGECPNGELKEVKERKRGRVFWMEGAIAVLLDTKAVVRPNENSKDCLKIFEFPRETSAASSQCRDIMAQISIDAFNREGVIFVVDIVNMLSWKDHIQISDIPIRTVCPGLRRCIYHSLNRFGRFVLAYNMTHDLPWFSAHHGHYVDIFPGFCSRLILQKPVQLIQLHSFNTCCGYFFSLSPFGLFLSNSSHWICSSPEFFLRLDR